MRAISCLSCILGATSALSTACGDAELAPASAWEATTDTVGDTIVVRTLTGSVWGDTAVLLPEIRIGETVGDEKYILGEPRSLAVAPDGRVYILDGQVPVIRAYDPDGRFEFDVGRVGEGPGEYKFPDAIAVLPDGRLIVKDPANARIGVYSSRGDHLADWPHPSPGFNTTNRFYVDTAGNSYPLVLRERGRPPWEWGYVLVRMSRWNGPPIPDTKPPFTGIFSSAEGNVWVIRSRPGIPTMTAAQAKEMERRNGFAPQRFREPVAFDVFGTDGSYLGPVEAPPTLRSEPEPIVRGDYMWAVTRDALDVAIVVRFRIVVPASG